ncbi:MAG TPA: ABC transporter permease [Candidatus Acidoferrum sp.]|nr:ABC transporter permease [Candidatus Acidoferrum sp.]
MNRRKRLLDDLAADIQEHLDRETQDNIARGMSPEEACYAARRKFGNVTQVMEDTREVWIARWKVALYQDVRFALRMLRKNPVFTAIAVLTLALGIGANTAIFTIVDAVLLRPFAYPEPSRLVLVFAVPLQQPDALSAFSSRDFNELREHNSVFADVAGNAFHDLTLTGAGGPAIVNTADVTPEIFPLLGAKPFLGRALLPEDGKLGAAPVALISESLWRSRFGSNPDLLGHSINLDMRPFTVVGILPAGFRYPDGAPHQDVWIPIAQDPLFGPLLLRPGSRALGAIARLNPNVTLEQAQTEMKWIGARFAGEFANQDSGFTIRVVPYCEFVVGDVKSALLILLGAVGLVLLIACANIANLLLSRATSRAKEIAMRVALGAGRGRIVRQLLTESVLLALFGGIAGLLLAAWGVSSLGAFLPSGLTQINSIHINGWVLVFALLLSFSAALVFGLAPALLAAPSDLRSSISEGGRRTGHRRARHLRSSLAIAEISIATVLLIAGGLLIRSFALVSSVHPGFDPSNVVRAEVSLPQFQYSTPQQWTEFTQELLLHLHALPGLHDSAVGAPLPMDRQGAATFPFSIVGNPPLPPGKSNTADYATVSPEYFRVMRIPLMRGRLFSDQDSSSNPKVAIISEALARRYFTNQDPLGRQMKFGFPPNTDVSREVVGVVGDVRDVSLSRKPGPIMYVPFAQAPLYGAEVVARSSLNVSAVAAGIRQAVNSMDKNLPVTDVESFPEALGASVAQERFRTFLLSSFSLLALILAAIGIFGVISYSASQRSHEIGVRVALGAQRRDVLRLILGQGGRLALLGLGVGVLAALLLTRLMASLLYGVSPTDPLTFGAVIALLFGVALAACYFPARRAMSVDPLVALRHE